VSRSPPSASILTWKRQSMTSSPITYGRRRFTKKITRRSAHYGATFRNRGRTGLTPGSELERSAMLVIKRIAARATRHEASTTPRPAQANPGEDPPPRTGGPPVCRAAAPLGRQAVRAGMRHRSRPAPPSAIRPNPPAQPGRPHPTRHLPPRRLANDAQVTCAGEQTERHRRAAAAADSRRSQLPLPSAGAKSYMVLGPVERRRWRSAAARRDALLHLVGKCSRATRA